MNRLNIFGFPADNGGRRRIKDRRCRIDPLVSFERRTGLKRRSGLNRRLKKIQIFKVSDRRRLPGL
ncbi:hypothetical protein [Desulfospira joergensenii]|uniref:hypothetical protein n=1 Tax=Desulfospira joergensenii TaxID=53329 RepID=UPI00040B5BE1|nr:hypothetical protein [Desulfospira joergensenii]